MYMVFFWVHINSDSAKREKNTVTFAICVRTIWYNREAVKFQDSGTKIKTSTTKDQFFLTLLERMVGESQWQTQNYCLYPNTMTCTLFYLAYVWYLLLDTGNNVKY